MLIKSVLRMPGLQYKPCLDLHELLADCLMCFRKNRVTLLIGNESSDRELDSVKLFSEESIDNLAVWQVRSEHKHH